MFATLVAGTSLYIGTALWMIFFADSSGAGFTWAPFVNMGGVGLVLAWVLWKLEPRMRGLEAAIERQSRAVLVLLIEIKSTSPEGRTQAAAILKELDEAAKLRGADSGL